ncbi:rubrerythrin [Desulfonema ishimotonii]|uniref:Rubrerythrin n=1 Tax=Desulfonema ishimotonii TaxID=45657 RepID=A0A401FWI7_9BACT|nr:ferritin family protein [Desulfonema ishimotonii]GBC61321.1 rubrerythrin [Desulfonema ishimotonii]
MSENNALNILKNAILLEERGRAFYLKVAEQAPDTEVREFFEMMAEEESGHIKMLAEQFRFYRENKRFKPADYEERGAEDVASAVLSAALMEKIAAAGFESAAISAAISMEERAVKLYAGQAEASQDPEEKKLYHWLAQWERGHLSLLMDMDRQLTEKIWNDNQFWPF